MGGSVKKTDHFLICASGLILKTWNTYEQRQTSVAYFAYIS